VKRASGASAASAAPALTDDRHCFACGPDNQIGLRMTFEYGDGTAACTLQPRREFGGWSNIMHGGIVATLLDEAMAHAAIGAGVRAVTARIEVRFRKPVPTDKALVVKGRVTGRRGRVLDISGVLSTADDGETLAESHARFVTETS
jgi:acyl-coenzyme A thioesterase PaaI-like protein